MRPHPLRRIAGAAALGAASVFDLVGDEHWALTRRDRVAALQDEVEDDDAGAPPLDEPSLPLPDGARAPTSVRRARRRWWRRRR